MRLDLRYVERKSVTSPLLQGCEAIYGCPPPELLKDAPNLRWHHLPYAGAEPYDDLTLYANKAVTLTNSSGVYGGVIAEHVLGMVLALLRQFPSYIKNMPLGDWEHHPEMGELFGSSVLICGMGDLGMSVADKLRLMGCKLFGIRRTYAGVPPGFGDVGGLDRLAEMAGRCDIVISALPSTRETSGVFNVSVFKKMRPHSLFINVGRGSAVVEDDLTDALERNMIAGAALDVFEHEPLAADSPLRRMENVLLTPHCAGVSPQNSDRAYEMFFDLLVRYISGRPLYNIVDFFSGY